MKKGAAYLVGEHDFRSFCAPRGQSEETVRTIYRLDVSKKDDMITLRVSGSGFLYNMVRTIAGELLFIERNNLKPSKMKEVLDLKDRTKTADVSDAKGLCLWYVGYDDVYEYIKKLNF